MKSLADGFANPPPSARPHTWYHMMNGNISKDGITRDFEELAKAGIGGVTLIDAGFGVPRGNVAFNSEEWFSVVEHAVREAHRLGMETCLENCSGWSSSGGPWVTPELAMKTVVWSETKASGPTEFSGILPRMAEDNGFHADIAVLAFRTPPAELSGDPLRIADAAKKTFAKRDKLDIRFDRLSPTPHAKPGQAIEPDGIVDLTTLVAADGRLDWDVPDGEWTILRFGFICNGRCNHPATETGKGLEIDKLAPAAAEKHFDRYLGRICDRLGPLAGNVPNGLNAVLIDSYEVGCQNWTQGFESEFEKRTGYPIRRWLPVLAGRVVGTTEGSERFLEDFRRTIADLFAANYARRYAEMCHSRGLQLQIEPYGDCPADDQQYGSAADVPMSEFWSQADRGPNWTDTRNSRCAAHISHIWGKRIAAAESFTGNPDCGSRWLTTPFGIKAQCDRAYANGVNRIVYHRFVHQPWAHEPRLPGMTMGRYGMHFDRTQTWWPHVGPWLRYQARCQWMLQEGTFCADVLFYCGEESPNGCDYDTRRLAGWDWDICPAEALEKLDVHGGRIVAPGGVSYALLVLPDCGFMGVRDLWTIERLLDSGAHVCCQARPVRSYGKPVLSGTDAAVRADVARIWAKGVMECPPEEALRHLGIEPDFLSSESEETTGAAFIHRRDAGADWYFVALNNERQKTFEASFRQTGRVPEIWDAETGAIADATAWRVEDGRTVVRLSFPPSGSAFVVFRRKTGCLRNAPFLVVSEPAENIAVPGPWSVAFPIEWYTGGSAVKEREWPDLRDWTTDDDPDIRYFSGTATYSAKVRVPPRTGGRVFLDLGEVKHFAVVTVNGRRHPALWRPPFRVDVTDDLSPGETEIDLRIDVTNLWPNRLIGDDFMEEDCEWISPDDGNRKCGLREIPEWVNRGGASPTGRHTFTTWRHWTRDDAPLPSGLLGPVGIESRSPVSAAPGGDPRIAAVLEAAREHGAEVTDVKQTGGCVRVDYVLRPTEESFIRCLVAFPAETPWSGRFWGFGNGGAAGNVWVDEEAIRRGDVAAHTDLGTSKGAWSKREVIKDFGWRATHLMTVSAKAMTEAYFGRKPSKCYFFGSSTGGGQGFHEALRFPEDYDGIVAYVPANTRLPLHIYFAWNNRLMRDEAGNMVFSQEEFDAVGQAAIDWFSDKDIPEFRGRFLSETRYDPVAEKGVLALASQRVPSLADPDKLERLHKMFTGPVLGGRQIHAGVPFSGLLKDCFGNQWLLEWHLGEGRAAHTVTDAELLRFSEDFGPDCDACGEGFARFAARGGKMLVFGGLEDSIVPCFSIADWCGRAAKECGGEDQLSKSCRLYLLPGRGHGPTSGRGCGNVIGDRDLIVRWVENGERPAEVVAELNGGGSMPVRPWKST